MDWNLRTPLLRMAHPIHSSILQPLGMNSAWLLLARVGVQVQAVLLTLMVAKRLGESGFGQYALIASLVVLGNVVSTFGTDTLLIRSVAQADRGAQADLEAQADLGNFPEVRAAFGLQILLSAALVGGVWLWAASGSPRPDGFLLALRIYSLSLFPLAFFSVFSAILRGLERMDLYLVASLGAISLQVGLVWLALQSGGGLANVMLALLAAQVISMLLGFGLCKLADSSFSMKWSFQPLALARLLSAAWPLALLSGIGVAYQRLGVFALAALAGDVQTGLYAAAARIVEALKLGHLAVLGALLPALARLYETPAGSAAAERLYRKAVWVLLGLGLAGAIFCSLFAAPLVHLLYGDQFEASIPGLQIMGWSLAPYSLASALAVQMVSRKREKEVTLAMGISLLAAAGLNWVGIPLWGLQGACLAALAAEGMQAGVLWGLRRRNAG